METLSLLGFLTGAPTAERHRPWPRIVVNEATWRDLVAHLAGSDWWLLGIWGEPGRVHMGLRDETNAQIAVVTLPCPTGRFPSVATSRPGAIRMERAIHDLFGLVPEGSPDPRPWLDHGRWPIKHPLAASPLPAPEARLTAVDYSFLPVEGEGLHQIPVGPVHAGIIEPGHFRFHANGETVARLEQLLGWVHKGIEKQMQGRAVADAARLACRVSGDSAVAHSLAFARAVEAATDTPAPPRAHYLRAVMAELERIANHLGDFGAICNDAAFAFLHTQTGILREQVLRAAAFCFGHRLMFDRVVPGGVAADLDPSGRARLRELAAALGPRFDELVRIYDGKASLQDRTVSTGVVSAGLVHRFGAGGYVARAASRSQDARRNPSYPPYDDLDFGVPVLAEGDVNARVWIRIHEIRESLKLLSALLDRLPEGPIDVPIPQTAGEGMALIEGFRGEILTWVRLDETGAVARCHPRDPSWFQWPLLEAAIENNIVADFPLCNKSFNGSYSGHDL